MIAPSLGDYLRSVELILMFYTADGSADTYFSRVQTYINTKITEKVKELGSDKYYNPKFWKGNWVDEWVDDMVALHDDHQMKATTIENYIHGLHKLNELVKEDRIFGKSVDKVRLGLKGAVKEGRGQLFHLHQEGVIDSKDHVTSMKPKGDELEKIIAAIPKTNRNYESVVGALIAQSHTGGRIKAELSLRVGTIDYGKGTKKYIKDKKF